MKTKPCVVLINPPYPKTKNTVRDLLYGCWCQGKRIAGATFPPLDLLSIAQNINRIAHPILIDYQIHIFDLSTVLSICKKSEYLILTSNSGTFNEDLKLIRNIKEKSSQIKIILFGPFATFFPNEVLKYSEIDFVILGEPELAVQNLLQIMVQSELTSKNLPPSIGARFNGKIEIREPFYLENLDQLAIPNRHPIKDLYFFNPLTRSKKWTTSLTSRGCPGRCNFCSSPAFYGKKYRYHSVDWMINEVKYLKSLGFEEIFYRDETFTANITRNREFCKRLITEKLNIKWIANVRVGTVTKYDLQLMKAAGCHTIKIGVESGSQKILNSLNKGICLSQTEDLFKNAHQIGLYTHAHMIIGAIGETYSTLDETYRFLQKINPTTVTFNLFTPFPGTPYYEIIKTKVANSNLNQITFTNMLQRPYFSETYTSLPLNYLEHLVSLAYKKFYLRPKYMYQILRTSKNLNDIFRILKSGIQILGYIKESTI